MRCLKEKGILNIKLVENVNIGSTVFQNRKIDILNIPESTIIRKLLFVSTVGRTVLTFLILQAPCIGLTDWTAGNYPVTALQSFPPAKRKLFPRPLPGRGNLCYIKNQ